MEGFQILDISGDVGLKAFGKSINEVFMNAAIGMYNLITNLDGIAENKTIDVSVESRSLEGLFVSWLNELIFHFDAYGFIGKGIVITEFTPSLTLPPRRGGKGGEAEADLPNQLCKLNASVTGEDFEPDKHESRLLIKAATYHRLRIEKVDDTWEADVIFDI
jgi:protein archease